MIKVRERARHRGQCWIASQRCRGFMLRPQRGQLRYSGSCGVARLRPPITVWLRNTHARATMIARPLGWRPSRADRSARRPGRARGSHSRDQSESLDHVGIGQVVAGGDDQTVIDAVDPADRPEREPSAQAE